MDQGLGIANAVSPPHMHGYGLQGLHIPDISQGHGSSRPASALSSQNEEVADHTYREFLYALGLVSEPESGRSDLWHGFDLFTEPSVGQDDNTSGDLPGWYNLFFNNSQHASSSGTGYDEHDAGSSWPTGALVSNSISLHPNLSAEQSGQLRQTPTSAPPNTPSWNNEQLNAGALYQQDQPTGNYGSTTDTLDSVRFQTLSTPYSPGVLVSHEDSSFDSLNYSATASGIRNRGATI
ncbi:hypothetical protein PLICRDRAFT_178631 [Plicaturopsis crispa FD-325 SS-3]|nr:hypothetical protein PLICRDRAFT_178631 [Plicaturopsis crispa FD-325 SS-3]